MKLRLGIARAARCASVVRRPEARAAPMMSASISRCLGLGVGSRLLDLEIVTDLVEFVGIQARIETARFWLYPEWPDTLDLGLTRRETSPDHFVRDLLEAPPPLPGKLLQSLCEIFV